MTLKQLKHKINALTEEQLKKPLIILACDKTLSGYGQFKKVSQTLYDTCEDDPAEPLTKKQLKDRGYDKEDIDGFDIILSKGEFYIELP